MPPPRRLALLSLVAVALLAGFAALPAPKLIFRRSPTVADRLPGDVRRVVLAAEPTGAVHAMLEVWTDSDWDLEYWSSIPNLTPKARLVTNDLVEQREVALSMAGQTLAIAYVELEPKKQTYTLKYRWKGRTDRDWTVPQIVEGPTRTVLGEPSLAVRTDGSADVVYVRGGEVVQEPMPARGRRTLTPLVRTGGIRGTQPSIGRSGDRAAVAFVRDGRVLLAEHGEEGWSPPVTISQQGRRPRMLSYDVQERRWNVAYSANKGDGVRIYVGDRAFEMLAPFRSLASVAYAPVGETLVYTGFRTDGTARLAGHDGGAPSRACCPAAAAAGEHEWGAWLESRRGAGIYRRVRLEHRGPDGPFTRARVVDVTALASQR